MELVCSQSWDLNPVLCSKILLYPMFELPVEGISLNLHLTPVTNLGIWLATEPWGWSLITQNMFLKLHCKLLNEKHLNYKIF